MRRLPLRSPPRVRGKAKNRCRSCPLTRITPACAGKSHKQRQAQRPRRDHPRVCGEKPQGLRGLCAGAGSPPRVRGKAVQMGIRLVQPGITPAYAGKSGFVPNAYTSTRDHPRVCGEKLPASEVVPESVGSPPRMRGKAVYGVWHHRGQGITPAYAGKSALAVIMPHAPEDHPRVCGEKLMPPRIGFWLRGSPPRVRGKAVPPRSAAANGCRGPSVPEYDAPP